ncbi:MAG: TM2 domain-containing protein [Deltaproteobacteria bacterium]|nr:MAG: TM2 domain-containing protein [Deltaproteobacteria bacterium]
MSQDSALETSKTSRVLYIVLAIFLGEFGVHNFLAGYTQKGLIQLLVTVFTCGIGASIMWIWALIEAATVTNDSEGRKFS